MIKKCTGCGIILQTEDINKEGWHWYEVHSIYQKSHFHHDIQDVRQYLLHSRHADVR